LEDKTMRITPLLVVLALGATAPLASHAQSSELSPAALARLAQADADKDGSITKAEFLLYRAGQFVRLDRNTDGVLSMADAPRLALRANGNAELKALIDSFDANKDGRVTRAEYAKAPTPVFDGVDANKNSVVDQAELAAAQAKHKSGKM
jgi:hypothetical protein